LFIYIKTEIVDETVYKYLGYENGETSYVASCDNVEKWKFVLFIFSYLLYIEVTQCFFEMNNFYGNNTNRGVDAYYHKTQHSISRTKRTFHLSKFNALRIFVEYNYNRNSELSVDESERLLSIVTMSILILTDIFTGAYKYF
jgi:hypothetical protein